MKKKLIQTTIDQIDFDKLKAISKESGILVGTIVRILILKYIKEQGK